MSTTLRKGARAAAVLLLIAGAAAAQPGVPGPAEAAAAAAPVYTRARVASFHEEAEGKSYVRLKLLPRAKIPFTTQTFRVTDRALLAGIAEGASVEFTSRHVDGENVVTSIRVVAECKRFQKC